MTLEKCTGCEKHCTFNAVQITNEFCADSNKPYYIAALDDRVVAAYFDNSGKKQTTRLCQTEQEAREIAKQISVFCCRHKINAK